MALWTVAIPPTWLDHVTDDTPQAVTEYLTGQGVTVQAVSVRSDPPALRITSDVDPTTALSAYAGQVSAARQALRGQVQTALQFAQAVEAGQPITNAQAMTALAATIRVLQWAVQRDGGL